MTEVLIDASWQCLIHRPAEPSPTPLMAFLCCDDRPVEVSALTGCKLSRSVLGPFSALSLPINPREVFRLSVRSVAESAVPVEFDLSPADPARLIFTLDWKRLAGRKRINVEGLEFLQRGTLRKVYRRHGLEDAPPGEPEQTSLPPLDPSTADQEQVERRERVEALAAYYSVELARVDALENETKLARRQVQQAKLAKLKSQMHNSGPIGPAEQTRIAELYRAGTDPLDIAIETHRSRSAISCFLKRAGLVKPPDAGYQRLPPNAHNHLSPAEKLRIGELHQAGTSFREIGKLLKGATGLPLKC